MSAHTRAMLAVLPVGLAKGHRGNPAAVLRVETLYGAPVLLSGLSALVLYKSEIAALHHHYKVKLEQLQMLFKATPECVVCFLGGSLPLTALLHLRQLSLLGMIARLGPSHILHQHGYSVLNSPKPPKNSWFYQMKTICQQYSLPDPILELKNPSTKTSFKSKTKSHVTDFWEQKLRTKAAKLDSLVNFRADYYSLSKPHPIWTAAGSNPYEVEKACVQAKMLSGRYRTCWLTRHWSGDSSGMCSLPTCRLDPSPGTLSHMLIECEDLIPARMRVFSLWGTFLQDKPSLSPIIRKFAIDSDTSLYLQFLLDCSVLPEILSETQKNGSGVLDSLLYLTRTLCFSLHKARLKLLGKWNPR